MSREIFNILAKKRFDHYRSIKENHDRSNKIIANLYTTITHFIFELLQNAEDEGANKVKILYNKERLIFEHNGNTFDINDIESITAFGDNERKKLKPNAIGRFGIGFKSVFSVTEKPEIKSGKFHFDIKNFIVPNLIDLIEVKNIKETIITLPFKRSKQDEIFKSIEKTLSELDSLYLLFLNNIQSIEIVNESYIDNVRSIKLKKNTLKDTNLPIYNLDEGGNKNEFLLFEDIVCIAQKKLPIKIAFKVNRKVDRLEFEEIKSSPLFAFFATDKETSLPFYIHAPFITTPARDNILENESRNDKLFSSLTELMLKAIKLLKLNNLIELKTWLVFPCNISSSKNGIYQLFFDSLCRYLLKEQTMILPTNSSGFCHVNNALKAKTKEVPKLISEKEAKFYFGRGNWVTEKLKTEEFEIIDELLQEKFNIPKIGLLELCEKMDDSFFAKQTDEWLIFFYSCISDVKRLWQKEDKNCKIGPLRKNAFIRTSLNKMVKPFGLEEKPSVYIPTDGTSNYHFVKSIFLEDNNSKKFFKSLGIAKPDLIAEVNEHVIKKIEKSSTTYEGINEDILKIFGALRKADYEEEQNLLKKLKTISWLPGSDSLSKKIKLYRPAEIYFPSTDLNAFLQNCPTAVFLDTSFFVVKKVKQSAKEILEDLGVLFHPRRFYKNEDELVFENEDASKQMYWNDEDTELEGLNEYLSRTVDKRSSITLWNLLLQSIPDWRKSGFSNTKFVQQLRETKWLFNKFGQRLSSSEITPSEFDEAYEISANLMEALNFKTDDIKHFELEHGGKFISNDEFQKLEYEMDKMRCEIERLKRLYEVEEVTDLEIDLIDIDNVRSTELSPVETPFEDNIPENHQMDYLANFEGENTSSAVLSSKTPTRRQKKIGLRGEQYVLKLLQEIYNSEKAVEIQNLNDNDKLGVGCDFIVRRNGIAEILIEVKSTEGGHESKFKISEMQWLTAIKSHLNNHEPAYHVYCVYNVGGTNLQHVIIKDPVNWMMNKKIRFVEQWFNVLIKRTIK